MRKKELFDTVALTAKMHKLTARRKKRRQAVAAQKDRFRENRISHLSYENTVIAL